MQCTMHHDGVCNARILLIKIFQDKSSKTNFFKNSIHILNVSSNVHFITLCVLMFLVQPVKSSFQSVVFYAICLTSISNVSSCFCKDFNKKKILWQNLRAKKIRTSGLALSDDTFYSYRTGWLIQISQSKTSPYLTVLCLRRSTCHLNNMTMLFTRYSTVVVLIKMDLICIRKFL